MKPKTTVRCREHSLQIGCVFVCMCALLSISLRARVRMCVSVHGCMCAFVCTIYMSGCTYTTYECMRRSVPTPKQSHSVWYAQRRRNGNKPRVCRKSVKITETNDMKCNSKHGAEVGMAAVSRKKNHKKQQQQQHL